LLVLQIKIEITDGLKITEELLVSDLKNVNLFLKVLRLLEKSTQSIDE
jgi:hypothetical protein